MRTPIGTGVMNRVWTLLLACAVALPAIATGTPPYRTVHQFQHKRWTITDGAPGQISALAQTRDGRFWLSAAQSLYRFDGTRFERFQPPAGERLTAIQTLHADADGTLWLGFQAGGVARLSGQRLTRFGAADHAPVQTVYAFANDRDGTLWAASGSGLFRYRNERWEQIGQDWGIPGQKARMVAVARDGTLWVASENTILTLPPRARRFVTSGLKIGWALQLRQAPDGRMWLSEAGGGVQPLTVANGKVTLAGPKLPVESAGLLFADDGSLWIDTLGDGVRRLRDPSRGSDVRPLESFTERDGLSADYAWPILQDREGSIWIGTSGGLDQFRPGALVLAPFPRGSHDFALVAGDDGAVWAGTTNRPLARLQGEHLTFADELNEPVRCAYRDRDGRIWLGGDRHLWRLENGRPRRIATLPEGTEQVQAMALGRDGALWLAPANGILWRWHDGVWQPQSERLGTRSDRRMRAILSDRAGRLWFGLNRGDLMRLDGDTTRTFALADTLKLGPITALAEGAERIWVGGQFGLAYVEGERVVPLQIDNEEGLWGVSAIIERGNGDVWVHAVPGIFHLTAQQLRTARAQPGYRMRFERFDFLDGLPGRPTLVRPLPTAVAGSDGRLWFATSNGVVWIDPDDIARNPLPPPVFITELRAGGRRYGGDGATRLPVGARNIEIAYTAPSMEIPARVRFRYRLQGFDEVWQDVGNRRAAYYDHLPPGRYRFQVIASNNDGVWNRTGATLQLNVPPAFYQTWWFRGLYVLATLALLCGLYLLRMRHVRRATQRELQVQHAERERIARDLHDTLLQSVQGLVLRFQSVVEQIPPQGAGARDALEAALDRADQVVAEARDRVLELRSHDGGGDLQTMLTQVGQELASDQPIALRTLVEGEVQPIAAAVQSHAFAIGREALFNAFQHARASAVEIEVAYGCDELRLRVRDDGIGIGDDAMLPLRKHLRPKHWGLRGMHERATAIGGTLRVWGRAGVGTEVELIVPSALAYAPTRRAGLWGWLRAASLLGR